MKKNQTQAENARNAPPMTMSETTEAVIFDNSSGTFTIEVSCPHCGHVALAAVVLSGTES